MIMTFCLNSIYWKLRLRYGYSFWFWFASCLLLATKGKFVATVFRIVKMSTRPKTQCMPLYIVVLILNKFQEYSPAPEDSRICSNCCNFCGRQTVQIYFSAFVFSIETCRGTIRYHVFVVIVQQQKPVVLQYHTIVILYFQNCKQLEAGETTVLLKTADMNQNESAKGDRGKGLPSVKC